MKFFGRLAAPFSKRKLDADMAEEMRLHLERRTEENCAEGMSPKDARFAALRKFGGVEQVKEIARDRRAGRWLDSFTQDLKFGVRQLRRSRLFAGTAVVTLALGIGVNVVAFSLINALFFRPLSGVMHADRLVDVSVTDVAYPEFEFYRDHTRVCSELAASMKVQGNVVLHDGAAAADAPRGPEYVNEVALVSGNYFSALGVRFPLGRGFRADEDRLGAPDPVVVLSHAFWQARFQGDPAIVGKPLLLNGVAFTVIGIAAPDFLLEPSLFRSADLWAPLMTAGVLDPSGVDRGAPRPDVHFFGRLAAGATAPQFAAELALLESQYLQTMDQPVRRARNWTRTVGHGFAWAPWQMPDVRWTVIMLLVFSGVVLLVAGANLANLLLARATTRQREISVRLAMGASRGRIVRQLLTENLVLGALGGGLGLLVATWTSDLLWPRLLNLQLSAPLLRMFGLDGHIAAYAVAISLITGLGFGLVPALEASRSSISSGLKQEASFLGRRVSRSRLRNFLIGSQVAVSVVLLVAASLLWRMIAKRHAPERGFETEHLFFVESTVPRGSTAARNPVVEQQAVLDRIRVLPGVTGAALGDVWQGRDVKARTMRVDGSPRHIGPTSLSVVTPEYFAVVGLPLRQGRIFRADEASGDVAIVVVSETFARRFWPGESPIGHRLQWEDRLAVEVVGVVADGVRTAHLWPNMQDGGDLYVPLSPAEPRRHEIWVRTSGEPITAMRAIADQGRLGHTALGLRPRGPMRGLLAERQQFTTLVSTVVATLGGLALLLAAIGVYGVMMYVVAQRTHEFGVRMALGASHARILWATLWDGARLIAWGVVSGGLVAAALATLARSWAFGVSPIDPLAFAGVALLLGAVALAACWFPARQATRVDPMVALRTE